MSENARSDAVGLLDLIGLKCPLPVLRTRKALGDMTVGNVLEVVADDPMCVIDIPHLLSATGDTLLELHREAGRARFLIRRGAASAE